VSAFTDSAALKGGSPRPTHEREAGRRVPLTASSHPPGREWLIETASLALALDNAARQIAEYRQLSATVAGVS
jgi:hypothetical protein